MDGMNTQLWKKLLLAVASPLFFIFLIEGALRLFNVNTELARNKNFKIGVPIWLLADPNWVHNVNFRMATSEGVDAEDVAWLAHFEEARYIQYRLKPGLDIQAVNPFNDVDVQKNITFRITSNSQGFRTREFTPKKPGTFRIVTLGDSSTFGWGIEPQVTWQYLLEKKLAGFLGAVEVFNLGISGHTTRHGLNVLRHFAWDLEPDLVVISYGANDARFVRQTADQVLAVDETFLGSVRWSLLKLRTAQLLRKWMYSIHDPLDATARKNDAPADGKAGLRAVALPQYKTNLETMIAEARKRNTATILLAICAPPDYTEAMNQTAEMERVPFIDSKRLFVDNYEGIKAGRIYPKELEYVRSIFGDENMTRNTWLYVTRDGCHPNRIGTNLISDALADVVDKTIAGLGGPSK